jgi:hypothetical protein
MKKKLLIIGGVVLLIVIIIILIVLLKKPSYTIRVSIVDDRSPDRILTVYNNKDEKVEVKRIEFLNGVLLCEGYNLVAYYGEILNVDELNVVLNDGSVVKARIIKEEVKK